MGGGKRPGAPQRPSAARADAPNPASSKPKTRLVEANRQAFPQRSSGPDEPDDPEEPDDGNDGSDGATPAGTRSSSVTAVDP